MQRSIEMQAAFRQFFRVRIIATALLTAPPLALNSFVGRTAPSTIFRGKFGLVRHSPVFATSREEIFTSKSLGGEIRSPNSESNCFHGLKNPIRLSNPGASEGLLIYMMHRVITRCFPLGCGPPPQRRWPKRGLPYREVCAIICKPNVATNGEFHVANRGSLLPGRKPGQVQAHAFLPVLYRRGNRAGSLSAGIGFAGSGSAGHPGTRRGSGHHPVVSRAKRLRVFQGSRTANNTALGP